MTSYQEQLRLVAFLKACVECSIYIAPTDPGLTYDELFEAGNRAGYQRGEISDALSQVGAPRRANARILPNPHEITMWLSFLMPETPDYRNQRAFDFVFEELDASARTNGVRNVRLERSVVVERGVANGLPRNDLQVAIAVMNLHGLLVETSGILSFAPGRTHTGLLSEQHPVGQPRPNEARARAYPLVKDVIERRADGRPKSAEPFEAFAEALGTLGYGGFRMWWIQMVAELRQTSSQTSPVTATVLSAALVEGALTFVVKHARAIGLGPMGSKTFDGPSTRWSIDDLVSSAASGNSNAILDNATRLRTDSLIRTRQRIHAGRMLSEFPSGPPDLRPEEARDALSTAEQVVRGILDWLQQHPPGP